MFNIIVNTRFSAIHCWPECPIPDVLYLKYPHRHAFHVEIKKRVHHDDRDVEFINLKNGINKFLQQHWENKDLGAKSCEQMSKILADKFDLDYVKVMEDGENGAEYIREQGI